MIAYLVALLLVGLVVGAIARLLLPGRDPMGCLGTAALGIAGSLLGGFLADLLFGPAGRPAGLHMAGFIGSVAGAMILLLLLRAVRS